MQKSPEPMARPPPHRSRPRGHTGRGSTRGGRRGTRTPDILLVSQMREAVPYSPTLTPADFSPWMFMALRGRFECSGDTTGASLGVRIAGAERHPSRHLAPLAGVRGLAPDVWKSMPGRLVEGWRAYAATAAPALVISQRTGLTGEARRPAYFARRIWWRMRSTTRRSATARPARSVAATTRATSHSGTMNMRGTVAPRWGRGCSNG